MSLTMSILLTPWDKLVAIVSIVWTCHPALCQLLLLVRAKLPCSPRMPSTPVHCYFPICAGAVAGPNKDVALSTFIQALASDRQA